jgi:hypothetical protein
MKLKQIFKISKKNLKPKNKTKAEYKISGGKKKKKIEDTLDALLRGIELAKLIRQSGTSESTTTTGRCYIHRHYHKEASKTASPVSTKLKPQEKKQKQDKQCHLWQLGFPLNT